MRKRYLVLLVVLLFGIFNGSLFSQFRIKPTVEINVKYEADVSSKLRNITIFNDKEYYFEKLKNNGKFVKFYDVKAGTYLINFDYKSGRKVGNSPHSVMFYGLYMDTKNGSTFSSVYNINKFDVKGNKNIKIDIVVLAGASNSDFIKNTKKSYKNFDYFQLLVSIGNIIEDVQQDSFNNKRIAMDSNNRNSNSSQSFCDSIGKKTIATRTISCNGTKCVDKFIDFETIILTSDFKGMESRKRNENDKKEIIAKIRSQDGHTGICMGYFKAKQGVSVEKYITECCGTDNCSRCYYKIPKVEYIITSEIVIWDRDELENFIKVLETTTNINLDIHLDCFIKKIQSHEKYHCEKTSERIIKDFKNHDFCSYIDSIPYYDLIPYCKKDNDCKSESALAWLILQLRKVYFTSHNEAQHTIDHRILYGYGPESDIHFYENCKANN